MKKMLFVSNVLGMITQFNSRNIEILQGMGYEVHVACNLQDDSVMPEKKIHELIEEYKEKGIIFHQVDFKRKFQAYKIIGKTCRQIIQILKENKFEFVHCHTPVAGLCGRIAARRTKVRSIYTAHGFLFFKGAPLRDWLIFFPMEWMCAWFTDTLITINKEDYKFAKKHLHARNIKYIPGVGIDTEKFKSNLIDKAEKRKELDIKEDELMLLSVGELSHRKNHETVIRAIANLNMPNVKYYICGKGELLPELKNLTSYLKLQKKVFFLGFREDVSEIYQAADLFIFPSLSEGLSVALMEAIACKTPVICSKIRGNTDLVVEEQCMFNAGEVESLLNCLKRKLINTTRSEFYEKMQGSVERNYRNLMEYDLENVSHKMEEFYLGGA